MVGSPGNEQSIHTVYCWQIFLRGMNHRMWKLWPACSLLGIVQSPEIAPPSKTPLYGKGIFKSTLIFTVASKCCYITQESIEEAVLLKRRN